ncbi:hypothetical protein QF048_007714 [Streptomyces sp. W4I9-2]|nr:hypothetical protein [Streptomyces sp. W4I9-2]
MLATPGALPSPAVEDRWAFEVKQDGQRAMIYLPDDGTVLVRARSGTDITEAYPELLPLADILGRRAAVLDGEIVALDDQGHSDFELLQQRMGLAGSPATAARMGRAGSRAPDALRRRAPLRPHRDRPPVHGAAQTPGRPRAGRPDRPGQRPR